MKNTNVTIIEHEKLFVAAETAFGSAMKQRNGVICLESLDQNSYYGKQAHFLCLLFDLLYHIQNILL